jgi:hypothetical protein
MNRIAKSIVIALAATISTSVGFAADLPSGKGVPVAPAAAGPACYEKEGLAADVFGFTQGSDVNDLKALTSTLTYVGAVGTRFGSFHAHGGTLQASYGLLPCVEVGPYVLGAVSRSRFGGLDFDQNSYGGGVEVKYKLLGRDVHGLGLTLIVDPSVTRTDTLGFGNPLFTVYNTGLRLFADKTLVPGKLYAAFNLSHDLTWTGPNAYGRSSTFAISGALSYQLVDGFYVGAEVRHLRRHASLGFSNDAGNATFLGPNMFWQIGKSVAINAAYSIQVAGKAKAQPGNLDLVNFNQHQFKAKIAYAF